LSDPDSQFTNGRLLALESIRKNGQPIVTPLLFIVQDGAFYMRTPASTAKVKRIRRHPFVRLAPADWRGRPVGDWLVGEAKIYPAVEMAWVNERFKEKYGLVKRLIDWRNSLRRPGFVVIEVTPTGRYP
jgi:PPOX class probable F420-dependent enzyme